VAHDSHWRKFSVVTVSPCVVMLVFQDQGFHLTEVELKLSFSLRGKQHNAVHWTHYSGLV